LSAFGSVSEVSKAGLPELEKVIEKSRAKKVWEYFQKERENN
jgi:hypothetical protein